MRLRYATPVLVTLLALLLSAPSAYAAVERLTPAGIVALADTIVEVRVSSAGVRAEAPATGGRAARPAILTDTRLRVVRTLKGSAPAELTLTQPGGTYAGVTLDVPDLPELRPGERCVLFLDDNGVIGGFQGKLEILDGRVPEWGMSLSQAEAFIASAVRGVDLDPQRPARRGDAAVGSALGLAAAAVPSGASAPDGGALSSAADGTVGAAAAVLIDSTFEGPSSAGWTMSGAPTWAATAYRAAAGTASLYGSGGGTGGRAAPGPVPSGSVYAEAVRTAPVSLASYNVATLEWDAYTDMTADGYNWVNVELANSLAGPWYMPQDTFQMGDSGGWVHYSVDLRAVTDQWGAGTHDFTGDAAVYVRLAFSHATGTTDEGAYVDNVRLTADSVLTPTVTSISPDSANAGVGDVITITGSNFGATRGTGKVEFLLGNAVDGSRIAADTYSTWNDTQIVVEVPRRAEGGPVYITNSGGAANVGYQYEIGYSTGGLTWESLPVSYLINENCVDLTGEGALTQAAMATWSAAGSNFRVQSAGVSAQTAYPPVLDGTNNVYWTTDADFPTAYLAMNWSWWDGTGHLIESDIAFDESDLWSNGAVAGRFDVQTVALHELGHAVQLDDQYGDGAYGEVMASGPSGSTRRILSQAEIDGAIYLYGPDGSAAPAAPAISSSSHASSTLWYANPDVALGFVSAGATGYSYLIDHAAATVPDTVSEGAGTSVAYNDLADGLWYFHARAVSAGGTWSDAAHRAVRIDTVAPTSSGTIPPTGTGGVTFTLSASDANAGVAEIIYQIDGGAQLEYSSAVTVSELGLHTLTWWAEDGAGNEEAPHTADFEVLPREEIVVVPVQGTDRFATAVESSQLGFATGADTVLIATGRNWPDALGASALAGALDAPILLTDRYAVPPVVQAEIARLGATEAIIIGGLGAVDDDVEVALAGMGDISSVERIAGTDRYDTARKVAQAAVDAAGAGFDGTVLFATGGSYADALAASPVAAANRWPILLVAPAAGVPDATLMLAEGIGSRAVVLGGTAAVSSDAYDDLLSVFGGDLERIAGNDRFDTASRIAGWGVTSCGMSWAYPAIATGRSPYDALAGGVVQGRDGSVLLLTEPATLPAYTSTALAAHEPEILEIRYFGGTAAVSQDVRDDVAALLGIE